MLFKLFVIIGHVVIRLLLLCTNGTLAWCWMSSVYAVICSKYQVMFVNVHPMYIQRVLMHWTACFYRQMVDFDGIPIDNEQGCTSLVVLEYIILFSCIVFFILLFTYPKRWRREDKKGKGGVRYHLFLCLKKLKRLVRRFGEVFARDWYSVYTMTRNTNIEFPEHIIFKSRLCILWSEHSLPCYDDQSVARMEVMLDFPFLMGGNWNESESISDVPFIHSNYRNVIVA